MVVVSIRRFDFRISTRNLANAFLIHLATATFAASFGSVELSSGSANLAQQNSAEEPSTGADWRTTKLPDGTEMQFLIPTVTSADYPGRPRREEIEGTTVVQLLIDLGGQIISCVVLKTAGDDQLDARACELYRLRARFRLHNQTKPLEVRAPVTWKLEPKSEAVATPTK